MSSTKLGRFHAPDPLSALERLHFHDPAKVPTFQEVDHEPKVAVLDQEDLHAQGILCSQFIPGAGDPDALGSCTANTFIEAISNLATSVEFASIISNLGGAPLGDSTATGGSPFDDTVLAERAAIGFYHGCTDQTAATQSEWPPTDCGSSGPAIYKYAKQLALISTEAIAQPTAESVVSLMQTGSVLIGSPWFKPWFEADADGFVDGDGSPDALKAAINAGIAGGHEYTGSAIEKLAFKNDDPQTGVIDPFRTVIRERNHWTKSFADNGSMRMHLSTLLMLGRNVDIRQFRRNAA